MRNRSGSYKKILIEPSVLKSNKVYLQLNLQALMDLKLPKKDFTTLYLLLFLRLKHPRNWAQRISTSKPTEALGPNLLSLIPKTFQLSDWEKEKLNGMTSVELFSFYNLKGIPQSINRTMIHWYQDLWKIEALFHIPNSRELLQLQVKNTRCITLITDPQKIDQLVLGTRDPLSFLLHDLMHADQFFNQKISLVGQLGFYHLAHKLYSHPQLTSLLKTDAIFKKEFEYVVSDMNAYVIHLFKCLKSSIFRTQNGEEFFNLVLDWWNMNESQKRASEHLNSPFFDQEDELVLKSFFESNQEIYP